MNNYKSHIILCIILILVFILGFITSNTINKKDNISEPTNDNQILTNFYTKSYNFIDSIEKLSVCYYDTANIEMLHYVLNYSNQDVDSFPDFYITNFNDTIEYTKDNFFKYVALYTVANNLLESRKYIINGLLTNTKTEIKQKVQE